MELGLVGLGRMGGNMAARLRAAGVSLSELRKGRKPGTRVATVKSHCLGLPTLLLEPAPLDQGNNP